ncbi:zinc finger ZZ-type and EF-hand domain-containing protein 1 isoform X2 [Sphaerodactylus townsendi]|uniref:zinc finger ZZ-type and EF-hand domain-containing protein 1 isoform X2 n=1 Tax=Sphaerodactylus townsendi TaxID=933632 RepID=UPI002025E8EB|nr:zinc finger ZZ-type and EF-hand domain-containing protein 1 isoform X2 [Sphaerodactylus townsendi]
MGTVGSHSEGEEEEEEEEGRGAAAPSSRPSAAPVSEAAMDPASSPAAQPPPAAAAPPPSSSFPPAAVLLGQARLREEAAARLREAPSAEPLLSRHHGALVRWLEERLGRGEQVVSLEQLCEALESRAGPTQGAAPAAAGGTGAAGTGSATDERTRNEEALAQFDTEGDGTVDVENMLEILKTSSGANLQGELSHVIRQLQACSLVPGFIDIFSESKERCRLHASMILRFLHRNRIANSVIPYPILDYFNNICSMRSSVLKDSLDRLFLKEKECPNDLNGNQELDKLKSVSKCYTHIETSSNSADIDKMTNGETSSFWQSDGSARSHWIRLKMKPDVILRHLSIAVAANDQSYMPQQVTVAVGRTASNLQEVRDVHIPSNVTGYVTLLENANICQMYVQINIKRCLSDGCDTRIHGLRAIGYQRVKKGGVSVCDASAIWYWSLLTSLVTASMETNPAIVQTILQNTQKALQHMPPLSLSPGSTDVSRFLSPNVLEEVDSFLLRITSCCASPEIELTLLAFALARGSIAKVLSSLCMISDHLETPYRAASLITSMATVRQNLLYKYGTPLRLTLQACDVKGKEDKSGPENLLVEPWTGDGFLTETGKTRASVILSTGTESAFQVTQIRIKVRRGAIGARCGLVFAYNCSSEKFHAEEHFKRFEAYDKWKLEDFRQFLKTRSGTSCDEPGEEDPVGWFEMEEEWDEVEIKMQQCRISKYLMVKFLCTRQDKAERLGVQGLSLFGYLRPAMAEPSRSMICMQCGRTDGDTVCGTTLLLKILCFIQQLAQDLVQKKESGLRYRSYLDFGGLDLKLFWNFYSRLHQNPREECIEAQTMILQLLQSCFSVLTADDKAPASQETAQSKKSDNTEAAEALYKHLCEVVDRRDGESTSLKTLKQEVNNTLLNGAAIFFPERHTRREQLFAMMKNITEQEHKPSAHLAFKSLCTHFSNQDPGGLLLLPEKGTSADLDVSQVLRVMETLLLVASRECEMLMLGVAQQDSSSVLSSLFWSVQGSLLSWCYLQLKGSDSTPKNLGREVLTKYVQLFLSNIRKILESLLAQHSGKIIVEKLSNSVFAMVTRQLMTVLQDFCTLDIPHCALLQDVITLTKPLNDLSLEPGENPDKVDMESWQQEQPVVLRTWAMESPHNYDNNCHDVTVFLCPGATYFEVEFDERCETERRYDYLEFTDARGAKTRYDTKVGTDKWPKKVTFKAGPRLQFLFHSDSSNNEWGYKFSVTAYGLPDIAVSWGLDLQLLVARLMGGLASQSMVLKSVQGKETERSPAKVTAVLNSPLWKPVFRQQMCPEQTPGTSVPGQTNQGSTEGLNSHVSDGHKFLLDFAKSDPTQEFSGPNSELFKGLIQACKKQAPKSDIVAGSTVDQAVNSTFAALVYLSSDLFGKLQRYVTSGGKALLSDEFAQVYSLADGIRIWMLEMKQKFLADQGSDREEKPAGDASEVNPETLAQQCIQKSLLLLGFLPTRTKAESHESNSIEDFGQCHKDKRQRTSSVIEADFQAADVAPACGPTNSASPEGSRTVDLQKQVPDSPQAEKTSSSPSKLDGSSSEQEDAPSPPSTPTRKPQFNRGRLRLLSFRSMEEPKSMPSIKEKYPILKHVLDFIKDQSLCHESVLEVLALRKAQAKRILEVLRTIHQCLNSLGQPHCFLPPCILFLLEFLACQKDFTNYFEHLEGCGAELHQEIRESYYQLLLFLVNAVKGFSSLNDKSLLPALSCMQASLLHLLDMGWKPRDLSFFVEIQLPQLLMTMSQENISTHDSVVCQWSEEDEIADYRQNSEWMDECQDGIFEAWCDKISQADPEKQRKMHMFIARYCDLLRVDISCDGCDEIAPWHRYHCLQCNDMDLCKTCFLGGVKPEGHEDNHEMVNMEYACNHCQGIIVGQRMNCNVCEDFDLCFGCYSAKKYSDSHLPTHSIVVYPMVTVRLSDRHRLIQPYLHNYSWLLFAALTLYSADLASSEEVDGEALDHTVISHARVLQQECIHLIGDCLMKAQQGKGIKALDLLCMFPEGESLSENVMPSNDHSTDSSMQSHASKEVKDGKKTARAPLTCFNGDGNANEIQASVDPKREGKPKTKRAPSSGLPPKKQEGLPDKEVLAKNPDLAAKESTSPEQPDAQVLPPPKPADEKVILSQEQAFAECSQKRILGLLAAMLPPLKSGSAASLINLDRILPLMFQVVISNAGHLNETYHLTLGLLGQLVRRLTPAEVDAAVTKVLSAKHSLVAAGDGSTVPEGWKATHLLFSLGAVCLDSRIGLDWACTMADILRALNSSAQWHGVIATFTDHCIKQLPFQLKHTNIFTLLVLVGFPEVLCMGTRSVYLDNANEAHNVIILKHFTEKNRAVVVDVKTRKRKSVKDYQLVQKCDPDDGESQSQLRRYLQHFVFITSHLLQTSIESRFAEAVEASWVLSLALKGLYRTLKTHAFEEIRTAFLQTGLLKLLVKKCSKGTGFSKTWLLRDLEILSIMLYSSKKEISSLAEQKDPRLEERDEDQAVDQSVVTPTDADQNRLDPLEGLDEATKICFLMTHDALDAPLHILRAMYELQMKRTDSFFLEVQKRFDGDVVTTDERIRTLAQKWQPSKRLRSEEQSSKAVDTDMIILPCLPAPLLQSKPAPSDKANEESNPITQKLITNTESDLQLSYAKQRRTKSSVLLQKELDSRSKKVVRGYLHRVNEATAVLYARHVLALLLAEWPDDVAISEEMLELSGPAHMTYILDMLMQLEEKQLWEKILLKVLRGCHRSMLATMALTACQFMEEPGMAVQMRESKHPYNNNTNFEDKVHIPGAIYLSIKFDPQCNTEEGCDELLISSSSDLQHDRHSFSGPPHKWTDFELPGDTLYYRFTSDMSNTEWGYKLTVTAGHLGRFQAGFEILKQMLSEERVIPHIPLAKVWEWQVGVACRQTGHQRLKAIHLLLKIVQCCSQRDCDLTLLKPLWQLFTQMENSLRADLTKLGILLPLHRALTELFFVTENRVSELGSLQEYLLALNTEDHLHHCTAQQQLQEDISTSLCMKGSAPAPRL